MESKDISKGKKRYRKNSHNIKKSKLSPVIKVDEETIPTGTISDNAINSDCLVFDMDNGIFTSNSSSEDETCLTDEVFTKILNQKRLDLLESEEIKEKLKLKTEIK